MDTYAIYDAMTRKQQGCVHGSPTRSGRSGNALAALLAQAHEAAQATDPGPAGAGEGPPQSCAGQGQGRVNGSPMRSGNALATLLAQAHRREADQTLGQISGVRHAE